jgi:hypothetical protein
VKRYHCGLGAGMYENAWGSWCAYEDAAKLQTDLHEAQIEIKLLRAKLELADALLNKERNFTK